MEKRKKTIMVTGASGFIGKNFIEKYCEEYEIKTVNLRITDVENINFEGIDTVLHLAGLAHQMSGAPEDKYYEINRDLTKKVAEIAKERGVKHFVFYSTVKVYGFDGDIENHDIVLNENSPCFPNDPYGKSKYEAENILKKLENSNFKVAIIRPPMVYGAGVKGNMLNLIKLVDKIPVLPFDYEENKRTIVGITNLLYMTKLIIDKEAGGIYLATDGEPVSIKDIVEAIEEGLNKKINNIKLPKYIFSLLCKIKYEVMVRLFGTLNFEQKDNYDKIGYKSQESMLIEIKRMVGEYNNGI